MWQQLTRSLDSLAPMSQGTRSVGWCQAEGYIEMGDQSQPNDLCGTPGPYVVVAVVVRFQLFPQLTSVMVTPLVEALDRYEKLKREQERLAGCE